MSLRAPQERLDYVLFTLPSLSKRINPSSIMLSHHKSIFIHLKKKDLSSPVYGGRNDPVTLKKKVISNFTRMTKSKNLSAITLNQISKSKLSIRSIMVLKVLVKYRNKCKLVPPLKSYIFPN